MAEPMGYEEVCLRAVGALFDELRNRRDRVVECGLAVAFLDHQALEEPPAIGGELGHPRDLLVRETDKREAILRSQLVHEVANRLFRRLELAALAHAA